MAVPAFQWSQLALRLEQQIGTLTGTEGGRGGREREIGTAAWDGRDGRGRRSSIQEHILPDNL